MKKIVVWCLMPLITVFVFLTLIASFGIDFLESAVRFTFKKIYALEVWAYPELYEKENDKNGNG